MGKLSSGIFGGVSGKVGNLTGSSWKGIQVVKSRPQSVAYPGTTGQVAQTTKMSAVVSFCKLILSSWIKPLWDRSAVKMSGYNAFVRANIAEFADGILNDPSSLVMSQGTMAATPILDCEFALDRSSATVTWDKTAISGLQNASDVAYLCYTNPRSETVLVVSGALRSAGTAELEFADVQDANSEFHLYLAFRRSNGTVVSNSSYFTDTTPVA